MFSPRKLIFPLRCDGTRELLLILAALSLAAPVRAELPTVFWVSQPLGPDETALVSAGGVDASTVVELARLEDREPGAAPDGKLQPVAWTEVKPLKVALSSLLFVTPKSWDQGVYAYRLKSTAGESERCYINRPDLFFVAGDGGDMASPGGWIQVHGTAIALPAAKTGKSPALLLAGAGRPGVVLHPDPKDSLNNGYRQRFSVPADLPEGEYSVYVHNGHGGPEGWVPYRNITSDGRSITRVTVRKPWPRATQFKVALSKNTDADAAIQAALGEARKQGGGTVQLPSGIIFLKKPIVLPDHAVLRGAGAGKTILNWESKMVGIAHPNEFDTGITGEMISPTEGATFGVADLSLVMASDCNPAIGMKFSRGGAIVCRVRIDLPNIHTAKDLTSDIKKPWGYQGCYPGVWLTECANVSISDCAINASTPIHLHASASVRVERNTLRWRHYLSHINAHCERYIFEKNRFIFPGLLANGVNTAGWEPRLFFTARFQNQRDVYIGDNTSESESLQNAGFNGLFGHDTSGGGFIGRVVSANAGTGMLTVTEPIHSVSPGSLVEIVHGKGAGQYRYAASRPKKDTPEIPVFQPWTVPPDSTSTVILRNVQGRFLIVRNDVPFDGRWSNYFTSHDVILAENKLGPAGADKKGRCLMNFECNGFTSAQGHSIGGFATLLHNQMLGNEIVRQGLVNTGAYALKEPPFPDYTGPTVLSVVYRNNHTTDALNPAAPCKFAIGLVQTDGLVFEGNRGVTQLRGLTSTWGNPSTGVIRNNTTRNGEPIKLECPKGVSGAGPDLVVSPK